MSLYEALKKEAYEANMEIPKRNLAIYTFGNVSAIDREKGVFAIKPSGVPYEELSVEKMVIVDLDGVVLEGSLSPSSDTLTHAILYQYFNNIKGIAHTHSTYATSYAQACKEVPIYGTTHADHAAGNIPLTKVMSDQMIKGNYEKETGNQIIECFKENNISYEEFQMILVACHGVFTWGNSAEKAVYNAAVLEEIAKMAYFTEHINPWAETIKETLIEKHYQRKHGDNAYYGQKK